MIHRDPIVEEVWRLRAEAWAPFGDDIHAYFEHIRQQEQKHSERLITVEEFKRRYLAGESEEPEVPPVDTNISRAS